MSLTTGGDAPFTIQDDFAVRGGSSLRSGDLDDNESSWIQTIVQGPGLFQFSYRVSSEFGWDFIRFTINGALFEADSGDLDWVRFAYWLGEGSYVLRWTYEKDFSISDGADAAWLDSLSFTPGGKLVAPFLVWQHTENGQIAAWLMDAGDLVSPLAFSHWPGGGWQIVAVRDFNRDGEPDLLWQNIYNSRVGVWYLDGTSLVNSQLTSNQPGSASWRIAAVADINADGWQDLLWQNLDTGLIAYWTMDGVSFRGGDLFASQPGGSVWRLTSATDLDGDGDADLFFQNTRSGKVVGWEMEGTEFVGGLAINDQALDPKWQVVAVQDMDGDTNPDFVWQNAETGRGGIWFLDADLRRIRDAALSEQAPQAWQIQNERPIGF